MVFNKISSSQERDISVMTFLLLLMSFFLGEYYIGLSDLQGIGTYKWADGTAAPFTNWNAGHPKHGKGVVMKMNGNSDDGKWQTKNMNSALRFICECPDGPCASR